MSFKALLFGVMFPAVMLLSFAAAKPGNMTADPDLVVKVIKDNLAAAKKCQLGVLKNGSFKSMDDKYKILSFDMYILNSRGQKKWFSEMTQAEIDLSEEEDVEIVSGDLVVIDRVVLIHIRSGNTIEVDKITERYLVR